MKKFSQAILLLLAAAAAGAAQPDAFLLEHEESLAKKPQDLTVELRLADNKTQFQQGEIVRVELAFSSTEPDKYTFVNRSYDRSGRLHMDGFELDRPADITDPLSDYFKKNMGGFVGGGIFSTPMLGSKPEVISYDLNEWMRFEKTGTYRLYISSPRVTIGKFYGKDPKYMEAISNVVEFEIVSPDKAWQQKKLAESIWTMDTKWEEKVVRRACETLRYLGTEAAALEMIRRFTGEDGKDNNCSFDFSMGLHGSPQRKFIVSEMERKISDPDFPVSPAFFRDLSLLSFFLHTPQKFPAWGDEGAQAEINKLQKLREDEVIRIARLLAVAVKNKKPAAYLTSAYTLFSFRASVDRTPADGIVTDDTMITAFSNLPGEKQNNVLRYYWDQFKMAKMLPTLRNIYARLEVPGQINQNIELRDSVLQRIYELAPAEGRNLLLAEIRRPEARVKDETLTLLTDKEIPEIEGLLLKRATTPGDADARRGLLLLERYGTPKASKALQAAYRDRIGNLNCAVQQSLINYFLKHEPDTGSRMVGAALDARKQTECYKTVFEDFNSKHWSKAVEEVTVSYLDDENIGTVKEIVEALERFASADVKERLWQRLEKLSAFPENDMAAKTEGYGSRSQPSNTLEMTLVSALARSPSWKLSETEFGKLAGLCVTKECKEWVGYLAAEK